MEEEDTGELGNSGTNPRRQVLQGCLMGQRQRDFGAKTAYPSIPTHFRSSTHEVHALSAGPQTHSQCAEAPATPTGNPAIISALTLKCRPPALPPEPWGSTQLASGYLSRGLQEKCQWLLFLDQQGAAEATTSGSRTLTSQALICTCSGWGSSPLCLSAQLHFQVSVLAIFLSTQIKTIGYSYVPTLIINVIMAPCFVSHSSIHALCFSLEAQLASITATAFF